MDILFATSFKNEQGTTDPTKVNIIDNGTTHSSTVNSDGLYFRVNSVNEATSLIVEPVVTTSKPYRMNSVTVGYALLGNYVTLSVFGLPIIQSQYSYPFTVSSVSDGSNSNLFINSRFVGNISTNNNVTISSNNVNDSDGLRIILTDWVVAESDIPEPINAELIDITFTELQNDWAYSGSSLIESMNKVNATDISPNASVYHSDWTFQLGLSDSENPVLIEGSGSNEGSSLEFGTVLSTGSESQNLNIGLTQAPFSNILKATDSITVSRIVL